MDFMEKIKAFWNEFKSIFFSNNYEEKKFLFECFQAFLKENGLENDFASFYDSRKRGNYQNQSKRQNYNANNRTSTSPRPKDVVIFVKADRGKPVIDHIRTTNKLDESIQDQLSEYTSYLWLGNEFNDSIFEKPESVSKIGSEYDVVAVKTAYPQDYQLKDKSDGYELRQLIKTLCRNNAQCTKISNRLPIEDIKELETYPVN